MKKRSDRLMEDAKQNAWLCATLAAFALAAGAWALAAWQTFGDIAGLLVLLTAALVRMAWVRAVEAWRLRKLAVDETVWEQRREVLP
jgi:hypothetical protein